jgi:UDPglucose--hexose-1-phosphate uridylyltransferase
VGEELFWREAGLLADGRQIIYYDEAPALGRAAISDRRMLPTDHLTSPQARWDPLAGEWVIVAAARQDRTFHPPDGQCPLCPSRPGRLTEIPASDYDVAVLENRFPSLTGAGTGPALPAHIDQTSALLPGTGRCEVVCFTAEHDAPFTALPQRRVRTVLEVWADRTATLQGLPGVRQVYCFENRGEEIGVTLGHPHGQIYAFGFVTPRTARMLRQAHQHAGTRGGNLFDAVVACERSEGMRVVVENDEWVAFVPAAARWPYEVLIFPARRVASLPFLDEPARRAFGPLYTDVLRRFDALFGAPMPYIAAWHQAPAGDGFAANEFGLHLQVFSLRRAPGKLKHLAGVESGMGVWLNDVLPEEAARRLREAG